ncbi:hypothetical protein E3N88_13416 [Mikania micrantha]|uniref:Uncharacterized protein n=1 Tax=Mikania micrantha TaxID=192012 RepID=A0A5N6PAU4_9ASTR|nr:hypothetical protein E3N88_13416 [Mikania micrantha]
MGFVIQNLGPTDRLAVIAFSNTGKQKALQAVNLKLVLMVIVEEVRIGGEAVFVRVNFGRVFECFNILNIHNSLAYVNTIIAAISVVVKFKAHAIVNLVVLEGDMILVYVVPLLDPDLVSTGSGLSCNELLQVADGVVIVTLHANLLPQAIVQHHLDHLRRAF